MAPQVGPRLPFGPLIRLSRVEEAVTERVFLFNSDVDATQPCPALAFSEATGCSRRAYHRWQTEGIPLSSAEQACDRLGLHPCEVWGDEWIVAVLGEIPA